MTKYKEAKPRENKIVMWCRNNKTGRYSVALEPKRKGFSVILKFDHIRGATGYLINGKHYSLIKTS